MTHDESAWWYKKVAPDLMEYYLNSIGSGLTQKYKVKLEYRGSFKKLRTDIEVLSVVEHQVQVLIPLGSLPLLASMEETYAINWA